jgi:hypothetical protein
VDEYTTRVYILSTEKIKKITSHGVRLFINTNITTDKNWDRIVWEIIFFTNNICSSFNALAKVEFRCASSAGEEKNCRF